MEMMSLIQAYLLESGKNVEGVCTEDLISRLYNDIFRYSVLTDPLEDVWVTKICVNGFDDVRVWFTNGKSHKLDGFADPQQAEEAIRRLLEESQLPVDTPFIHGKLKANAEITVFRPPAIMEGIRCIVEKSAQRTIGEQDYLTSGFAVKPELDFLKTALLRGTSILLTGLPKAGKTAFLQYLFSALPDDCGRTVLESGGREIEGSLLLNKPDLNTYIAAAHGAGNRLLAFNFPSPLVVMAAWYVPAVLAQSYGNSAEAGLNSLAYDAAGEYRCGFERALMQACRAFPLIVSLAMLPDGQRRLIDITENRWADGHAKLNPLWEYDAGRHTRVGRISEKLLDRMKFSGLTPEEEVQLTEGEKENA